MVDEEDGVAVDRATVIALLNRANDLLDGMRPELTV